jgi:hypothetical protein
MSVWSRESWDTSSPLEIILINSRMIAKIMETAKIADKHPGSRIQGIISGIIGYKTAQMVAWSLARSGDKSAFRMVCEKYVDFEATNLYAFFGENQTPSQLELTMDVIRDIDLPRKKLSQVMRRLNKDAIEEIYALGLWENIGDLCDCLAEECDEIAPFSTDLRDYILENGGILTDLVINNLEISLSFSKDKIHIAYEDGEGLFNFFVDNLSDENLYCEALKILGIHIRYSDDCLMEALAYRLNSRNESNIRDKLIFCYMAGCPLGNTINDIVGRTESSESEIEIIDTLAKIYSENTTLEKLTFNPEKWMNPRMVEWVSKRII